MTPKETLEIFEQQRAVTASIFETEIREEIERRKAGYIGRVFNFEKKGIPVDLGTNPPETSALPN